MIYAKEKPEDAIRVLGKQKYDQIARQTGLTGGKGHTIYEEYRELVKRPNSPENVRRLSELETESKNYYKNFLD
jgi:phosphoribosylamine-glycine ligase